MGQGWNGPPSTSPSGICDKCQREATWSWFRPTCTIVFPTEGYLGYSGLSCDDCYHYYIHNRLRDRKHARVIERAEITS